ATGAAQADLDPPDVIGGDHHVILDGPGQSRVQPGPEMTVDDPAETRADGDLARLYREDPAAEIEGRDDDAHRAQEPRGSHAYASQRREPVAHAGPLRGHRAA